MSSNESSEQIYSEMKTRIKSLESLSGDDLKQEMSELKKSLLENPQACLLLLPEDIGEMVTHLRRIVGTAIQLASAGKTKTKKEPAKRMTAQELSDALEDM